MIEFVQATKQDVFEIYPQVAQSESESLVLGKKAFEHDLIPLEGRAVAVRDEGLCIGAYGVIEMWPGVARIWALFSESLIQNHPVLLGLHAKRDLNRAMKLGFHRIEVTTSADHITGMEFLARLGFVHEGLMRRYTPGGGDTHLYAKVRDVA